MILVIDDFDGVCDYEHDKFMNFLGNNDNKLYDNLSSMTQELKISRSTLDKNVKRLKRSGDLVSYRYRDNHIIWIIGEMVSNKYTKVEALQIAQWRKYEMYADKLGKTANLVSELPEEKIVALVGKTPIFSRDNTWLVDNHLIMMARLDAMITDEKFDPGEGFYQYVDDLWMNYQQGNFIPRRLSWQK